MESSRWDPNAEIICPYDKTHVISVKRFQRHLVKCRQNHPDRDFVACPFNARHMFLRSELRTHLAHCVDKVTLDADVIQEQDPETGDILRLKGKTAMPRAPENIPDPSEDWDDEIEENLAVKYAEQEEYIRLQGYIAKKAEEEEPLLRRPNFQNVNKPNLPVLNKPVYVDNGQLTSLRRPNLPLDEKPETDQPNSNPLDANVMDETSGLTESNNFSGTHESGSETDTTEPPYKSPPPTRTIAARQFLTRLNINSLSTPSKSSTSVTNTVIAPQTLTKSLDTNSESDKINPSPYINGDIHKTRILSDVTPSSIASKPVSKRYGIDTINDCDNESMISDSSWVSSVYEPIKRYSNKVVVNPTSDIYEEKEPSEEFSRNIGSTSLPCAKNTDSKLKTSLVGLSNSKTNYGMARGKLLRSLEGSAFTTVTPTKDSPAKEPAGVRRGSNLSNSTESPKKGLGRGNLKLAALNFQST